MDSRTSNADAFAESRHEANPSPSPPGPAKRSTTGIDPVTIGLDLLTPVSNAAQLGLHPQARIPKLSIQTTPAIGVRRRSACPARHSHLASSPKTTCSCSALWHTDIPGAGARSIHVRRLPPVAPAARCLASPASLSVAARIGTPSDAIANAHAAREAYRDREYNSCSNSGVRRKYDPSQYARAAPDNIL